MDDPRKLKEVLSLCDIRKRHKVSVAKRDWQDLFLDLLILVVRKINSVQDYFAFRGVCKLWRHAAATYEDFEWTLRLPFLVQAKNERVKFSNPLAIQQQLPLPAICNTVANMNEVRNCVGCKGWILVVHKNGNMNLVHIMSGAHIRLPYHEKSHSNSLRGIFKMVLSSSPLTSPLNCTLMIVYRGGSMAYWRHGDKVFTEMPFCKVLDVIYSSKAGSFYGLSLSGSIVSIKGNGHEYPTALVETSRHVLVLPNDLDELYNVSTFLVESDGDLLRVIQYRSVTRFRVYKIEEPYYWYRRETEIKNLGNRAIFVGCFSTSISVKASEIPGCKPNCIYFAGHGQKCTNIFNEEKYHMGVYNLADGLVEHFGCSGTLSNSLCSCCCPPLWVIPTFV